ncbi:cytochrome c class I [Leadbetterella byssophila DSM 17132]|uniref:Cytochrome c class I n=1 Tax=Leadbetterella byssophila (strain DSM 17132 / JCM 16389 / KACC 11308 / NBRC 106382 / 4M15) TaxID=649349 RepID=E4RYB8_LEAB4|nr:membrane protein [Leadbetterella byssophila]ADQ18154.1 cytochrome c class I [Leadbetterella byssophila DSM 17132]
MKKILIASLLLFSASSFAQESPKEEDFYKIITLPVPEGILLEVGGVEMLPNGSVALSTRRGDIWIVDNPTSTKPYFRKFASGLHEILGLLYKDGSLYCAQRGELTKLTDSNGDGKADKYETIHAWDISGHYHEYSFGPKLASDGKFFVSGNVAFGDIEWWRGESRAKTRGTIFKVSEDGQLELYAAGVRSPAGLGMIDGELFYTDNQGDWIGSGGLWHVQKGKFYGNPASLRWKEVQDLVGFTEDEFYKERDVRRERDASGNILKPENKVEEVPQTFYELKSKFPNVQPPAVWLPHGILGISNSEILVDHTGGDFGPFSGQVFVGDQGQSKIMRVFLEKVNGEYQGAAWDFRSGFQSGVLRMTFAPDGSMFVGETNRGWGSAGDAAQGFQRLIWNGKIPFEMLTCKAMPDGFEIEFTMPIDQKSAENLNSYSVRSFIYKHHPVYGSPQIHDKNLKVKGVKLSADRKKLRIVIDGLRPYFIHELNLEGIRAEQNAWSLVHPTVYYTLNHIPDGQKLSATEIKGTAVASKTPAPAKTTPTTVSPDGKNQPAVAKQPAAPTFASVKPLLQKHTCLSCHDPEKKMIGPSFKEIAKRKYTNAKMISLIKSPKAENWPDYPAPMPPMSHVPQGDLEKIATYINSLK